MGQTKKLLDELEIIFPDDMDLSYQQWLEEQELQKSAYEEMLADTK